MKLRNIYIILALLGIPVIFMNLPIGLGWAIGHLVMAVLDIARNAFYDKLLSQSQFKMSLYFSYIIFTIGLIALPLIFSFFFREIMEPLAIFAAYFTDRILTFVVNLFKKEEHREITN